MDWGRWFRHAFATQAALRRAFPPAALAAIERAVDESERSHAGEIRVAIEAALDPGHVRAGRTPRDRALEVFAQLGVWDTHANNGVLIYVLLADRDVEIVADRGFNGRVAPGQWTAVCGDMERHFRAGNFREGALVGVREVGRIIATHYPQQPGQRDEDELPNRPALL
jgi:uncharacterized membrane protein